MQRRLRESVGPILKLFIFLIVVFLFLGLQMSAPYTRAGPECSVWCVLDYKVRNLLGADTAPLPE
jgi:hypothetical protein